MITSEALYEVAGPDPKVTWSYKYDSGSTLKPGQLSRGSGTTPTFFGPANKYVGIVDNADNSPNFIVLNASDGREVCKLPAFTVGGPGTENSVMAWGNSVWVPSTYGFKYPPMAVDGPSKPPFTGGLTRIDVTARMGEHDVLLHAARPHPRRRHNLGAVDEPRLAGRGPDRRGCRNG